MDAVPLYKLVSKDQVVAEYRNAIRVVVNEKRITKTKERGEEGEGASSPEGERRPEEGRRAARFFCASLYNYQKFFAKKKSIRIKSYPKTWVL